MKNFALIIPVYQTSGIFRLFLNSLAETLDYHSQIIFVNDGSEPQISSMLCHFSDAFADKADITILEHTHSRGCAASINEAMTKIKEPCDYVILLDSDLILQGNWQKCLIEDFTNSEIGIVGGILLYPQTGGVQCCGITYQNMTGRHLWLNASVSYVEQMGIFEIQTTVFAFCAIRYAAMQAAGIMDESFFNGYEDWDYQFRIRNKGFKAVTDTRIQHFHWEKSNGIHRDYNRKSNLGRFWSKHGVKVQDDLCYFIKKGLEKDVHLKENSYVIIDLCEAKATAASIHEFIEGFEALPISSSQSLSELCGNQQTIWLPEVLNSQAFRKPEPYLFLCDHYIRLLDNQYWWTLRRRYCMEDRIIDTYGNVVPFKLLQDTFWPGTKIR